ncbi:MAG: response regulator [Cyanobacteria bacterium P01_A01_bin.135]
MGLNGHNILLVEDDPNDVLFIQRAFRQVDAGIPVQVVSDGDAAVDYLAGQGKFADRSVYPLPVLILLDLKLPRRSGAEVLDWMRQQPVIKRIPVVILTSSRENIDINRTYDLGINSYLVKPVNFNALADMIRALEGYWLKFNEYPLLTPS